MRKESACEFWRRYLNLVCNGAASLHAENPVCGFTVRAKAGEYDDIPDVEYDQLLQDTEQMSAIWRQEPNLPARDILLNALRMTTIDKTRMDSIVETLAQCSARSDYLRESGQHDRGPSLHEIHAARTPKTDIVSSLDDWTPRAIYDYICQRVHGQDAAKKAAAMVLYNHVEGRRSNAVFCGPSGCGKSEIWRCLAKEFPCIIRIVDASRLTADGWRGSFHLRDIFDGIPAGDLQKRGLIVVLDEADKLCCETAIGAGGTNHNALTQNSLLKMLDGDIVEFGDEDHNRKAFSVDCSRVSVVMLGAFEQLMKGKSRASGGIGFGTAPRIECGYGNSEITYDDLISAGMRREIAGRINRIVPLRPLSADDYRTILMGPVLDDLQAAGKCCISLGEGYADSLVEQAMSTGLGVRWMKSQLMNALDDLMFDDPTESQYVIKIPPEQPLQECRLAV